MPLFYITRNPIRQPFQKKSFLLRAPLKKKKKKKKKKEKKKKKKRKKKEKRKKKKKKEKKEKKEKKRKKNSVSRQQFSRSHLLNLLTLAALRLPVLVVNGE